MYQKLYGNKGHATIACSHHGIGLVYQRQQNSKDALWHYEQGLEVCSVVYGGEPHQATAMSHELVGNAHYLMKQYLQASQAYSKSWEILKQCLGPAHPKTQAMATSIAKARDAMRRSKQLNTKEHS